MRGPWIAGLTLAAMIAVQGTAGPEGLVPPADQPIRLGRYPALSPQGDRLCFTYQGNLWTAPSTGGVATRLTANEAYDSNPRWSPDGRWIAFNSDREGGSQIFLIPALGGPARQLTFHSSPTTVHDWFPDGRGLLVTSARETFRAAIYRLDAVTGRFRKLIEDECACAFPSISPNGKWIAYQRGALVDLIRKNYRGAAAFEIYTAPADGSAAPSRVTQNDRNDWWPLWGGDSLALYCVSERDGGTATVWKQPAAGGAPEKLVQAPPNAIRYPTIARNGSLLAYECDGGIYTAPCNSPTAGREVKLICRTDERGPRTTQATYANTNIGEFALSPDGKRVAVTVRGDIFLASTERPAEARRLTDNPTRDGNPAWSPDGKTLAFVSNRAGSFRLYAADVATRETRPLTQGDDLIAEPAFSPDGAWIAFLRRPQSSLWVIKPDGSGEQKVASGPKVGSFQWSPDGRWLAFEKEDDIRNLDVWAVRFDAAQADLTAGAPINITDHPGFNDTPRWTADGARLLFRSNRHRNRDIETINDEGRYALFAASLQKETPRLEDDPDAPKPATAPAAKLEVKVDPDEIELRARQVVGLEEGLQGYDLSPDGKTVGFISESLGQTDLWQASSEGGALQRLTTAGITRTGFGYPLRWSPDSSRLYYLSGGSLRWVARGGGASGTVAFTARMEIDRLVDYRAVFDEAWQTIRDRFYDRSFHGADWKAVGDRYRGRLDDVTTRRDFNYLVTQMLGELNASHTGITGGVSPPARDTGYLGVWLDEAYDGPGVKVASVMKRGPTDRDESRLKPGDYVLAVDGTDVAPGPVWDKALTAKTGRTVSLTVNDRPTKDGARTFRLRPISRREWSQLWYERWIDRRRAIVDQATGGRMGYLHVSDMGDEARNRFERELFSIGRRKEGMVLDLRFNGGGDTHDSLLRILERNRYYFRFAPRLETPFPQPERAYTKPVVLLINEHALSDAEVFANGFKALKLGKVVGQPTMGWIIFTYGWPLVDGSLFRVPHLGCYTMEGRDMENWGVPPDIRVENTPADYWADRDPQLERAARELLAPGQ